MANTTVARVSRAPARDFACAWCMMDIINESAVVIGGDQICTECTKESVTPKFHEALKFEIEYPVKWGPAKTEPKDFAEFFDDYSAFAEKWAVKEFEYMTPGRDRIYCRKQGCEGYIGNGTARLLPIAFCDAHQDWVCSRCGHPDAEHECKLNESEDELGDVQGCQRCPRGCIVSLVDGCNLVDCECGAIFCYCCGKQDPQRDHFARGKPCPKFGIPGAEHALFTEDVFDEELGAINEEREQQEDMVRWAIHIHERAVVLGTRRPDNTLVDVTADPFGPGAILEAHRNILQAIAAHPNIVDWQREIFQEHRQIMESIAGRGPVVQQDLVDMGLMADRPEFGEELELAASLLAVNVDLYIEFEQIRGAHAFYSARHA